MANRRVAALLGVLVLAGAAIPASAANPFEKNFWMSGPRYDGVLPPCEHTYVLERIQERFHSKEYRFWNSDLKIVGFQDIRETSFRPWAAQTIPRRFCSAVVLTSDGVRKSCRSFRVQLAGGLGRKGRLQSLPYSVADELGEGAADELGKLLAHRRSSPSLVDSAQEEADQVLRRLQHLAAEHPFDFLHVLELARGRQD